MKTKRRGYLFLCLSLALGIFLLTACGPGTERQGAGREDGAGRPFETAYLGGDEHMLLEAKGKGLENIAVIDGKEVVLSRVYKEKFLGYDSELTVMLSSSGMVEYALYSLQGDKEELAAALSKELGKDGPDEIETQTPGLGYKAVWRQKPYLYTMIAEENQITVAVIKE